MNTAPKDDGLETRSLTKNSEARAIIKQFKRIHSRVTRNLSMPGTIFLGYTSDEMDPELKEKLDAYAEQMAAEFIMKIDSHLSLVVKKKPKYMPSFLYKMVIRQLIEVSSNQKKDFGKMDYGDMGV